MKVVVTGVPGVGKTTVLNGVLEKLKGEFKVVNYGDEMAEVAKKNRDELRRQPPEVQKKIQKAAARRITGKAKKMSIIVDTHCSIRTPNGYLPGLPLWVLEELRPSMIILLEADSSEILGRRVTDETRERDADYAAEIEEHQQMNRSIAMAYAALTGATVKIIKNRNNKLEEAIQEMVNALR